MYVKIVPAQQLEAETHVIECERIEYKVESGAAEEVRQAADRFLNPQCGPDDEPSMDTLQVGYCRMVVEPKDGHILAALVTVHRDGKWPLLVVAYESSVFLMNEKGATVDRVNAHGKF